MSESEQKKDMGGHRSNKEYDKSMKQHRGGYEEDNTQRECVTRSSCSVKYRATLENYQKTCRGQHEI